MDKNDCKSFMPIPCEVEKGEVYIWCGCGESLSQPFCDKSNCGDKSVSYRAIASETVFFCACKQTQDPPFCDGSHSQFLIDYLNKR